jgi:cell division protein FtsB
MKRSPKKKLTNLQEGRLKRLAGIILAGVLLWFLFAPERGVLALFKKRSELQELQKKNASSQAENARLREQLDRLKKDPAYLEDIARREYGLLKEHEIIYDFSKPEKKEE